MNIEAIKSTAVTSRAPDGSYVTESPLCDTISGAGDTPEESLEMFHEMLDLNYQAYLQNKHALYNRPGRPAKGKVALRAEVAPAIKDGVAQLAKEKKISQGEAVEFLVAFYKAHEPLQTAAR